MIVVGNHDRGVLRACRSLFQQVDNVPADFAIERSGRFVGQHHVEDYPPARGRSQRAASASPTGSSAEDRAHGWPHVRPIPDLATGVV